MGGQALISNCFPASSKRLHRNRHLVVITPYALAIPMPPAPRSPPNFGVVSLFRGIGSRRNGISREICQTLLVIISTYKYCLPCNRSPRHDLRAHFGFVIDSCPRRRQKYLGRSITLFKSSLLFMLRLKSSSQKPAPCCLQHSVCSAY